MKTRDAFLEFSVEVVSYIDQSNRIEDVDTKEALQDSLKAWEYLEKQKVLTKSVLLKTHKLIMGRLAPHLAGKLRTVDVSVGNRICPAEHMPRALARLMLDYQAPRDALGALRWHVDFEKIHPFGDGNGRTGRMLYWFHCLQVDTRPILFTASRRQEYYALFR